MTLYQLTLDSVLDDPWALRDHAVSLPYAGERGPDGVVYPNISGAVPERTKEEVAGVLSSVFGPIDTVLTFFRLSLAEDHPPHWAHTDAIISDYLALLYLSLPRDCTGGTSIVEHINGMRLHPKDDAEVALWRRDTNRRSAWREVVSTPMRFNRMLVLPTNVYHAATPHGFGTSARDGRLVLITFFSPKGA